ncbi:hypothetical protein ACRQE5_09645 [Actinotignum sp. GS-2025b]|uniref:hypothetical protein n=1 Tax=Actinotignum sp. GS-2025b TaxID=3427275 RepID=UPI003F4576E8
MTPTPEQIIAATREHFAKQMLDLLFRMGREYDREASAAYESHSEACREAEYAHEHGLSELEYDAWGRSRDAYTHYEHARGMDHACGKHRIYIREFLDKVPTLAEIGIPDARPAEDAPMEVSK